MGQAGDWIMAFDPGGTTGYVRHFLRHNDVRIGNGSSYDYQEGWSGGELGPNPHHAKLWSLLSNQNPDLIICETFDNDYATPGVDLISRNYLGVIELYCALTGKPLIPQRPAIKQAVWLDDDALKRLRLHTPGKPHRNDAVRHVLYYVAQTLGRKSILSSLKRQL